MKKRIFAALLAVLLLAGCGQGRTAEQEIIVFAAASMTETLTQLAERYEADHPGVTVVCSFDSSGTLKTQIQEGAECDLFLSAGQKQMDELSFLADTRINLLENKIALVVPEGNPKGIRSFDDLAAALEAEDILLAMGNSDVPVGQYTGKILAFYGLCEDDLAPAGVLTYGTNAKEVTTQVREAAADCGVVYCTDAFSAGLTVVDTASEAMCGRVVYPVAVMEHAPNPDGAKDFLNYLTGSEAMAVFASVGFSEAVN